MEAISWYRCGLLTGRASTLQELRVTSAPDPKDLLRGLDITRSVDLLRRGRLLLLHHSSSSESRTHRVCDSITPLEYVAFCRHNFTAYCDLRTRMEFLRSAREEQRSIALSFRASREKLTHCSLVDAVKGALPTNQACSQDQHRSGKFSISLQAWHSEYAVAGTFKLGS